MLRNLGLDLNVVSASDITGTLYDRDGIDFDKLKGARSLDGIANLESIGQDAIEEIESDLVVEVTPTNIDHGQPGLGHIETALTQGKHVVTSNKGPLVVAYSHLKELAEDNGVMLKYEATVGGTMPLVRVCDAATGEWLRRLPVPGNEVRGLAFSADGRWLAASLRRRTVRIWDAKSYELVRTLEAHSHEVKALAFSPDSRRLATAGFDNLIKIWSLDAPPPAPAAD